MSTINTLFQQSQLAEAAYASFIDNAGNLITTDAGIKTALQNNGMSTTQAAAFISQYRVVDQILDTASGFSATVFEKLDANGNGTRQYTFAPRGTQGSVDILQADLSQIARSGVAYNQIVDMYNYWQSLNTAAGSTYQAMQVQTLTTETQYLAYVAQTGTQQEYDAYKAQLQSAN